MNPAWWQGRVLPAIGMLILVGLAAWSQVLSFEAPRNQPSRDKPNSEQKGENVFAAFWKWTTSDPVATYTAVLTLFTGVLAYGTWRLVQDGKAHSERELRAYAVLRTFLRLSSSGLTPGTDQSFRSKYATTGIPRLVA